MARPLSAAAQSVYDILEQLVKTQADYVKDINSDAIRQIRYNPLMGNMTIIFTHNNIGYFFENVPLNIVARFMASHSKGRFYHKYIKNQYSI